MVTTMNSHHNLPEIFYLFWDKKLAKRGGFIDLVFRMILFHHSVPALKTHPNMVDLSSKDQGAFCDI